MGDHPDRLLQRYTSLGVAVNIAGNTGRCGEFQPVKLVIDGATVVTSQAAVPPAPVGFQSLPQPMLPRLQVGIGDEAFDDTVRAAQIIEGLQRLSALPIDTQVVSVADALNSELPAVVVSADGWDDQRVQLPVSNRNDVIEVADVEGDDPPETLTLDPSLQFGSLQTVFNGKRTVLIATSTAAPAELDALLGWLDSDARRWSRLSGDAVLQPAGRDPVMVASQRAPSAQRTDRHDRPWVWWVAGAAAAVAVLGTGLTVLKNRRREQGG